MRTEQQENIVSYIKKKKKPKMVAVSSIAGSGKTFLLTEIAKSVDHTNGLYLAYNKSIALESKSKFPSTVNCLTTHSLAYKAIVTPNKDIYTLAGNFGYRDVEERIKYEDKCYIADLIKEFCLSKYTLFTAFAEEEKVSDKISSLCIKYLSLMQEGKINITHEFYLKLFHILLNEGDIEYEDFDFIMLDEAGDLNEVTLEIFKLLPSKLKILVGDPYQNIYSFNHTINCFEELKDESKLFTMSQSFRVNKVIAASIEKFCKNLLNPDMEFKGVDTDKTITSRAFISKTNASLVKKMIELNADSTPYGLIRKARDIFKLPLMLCSLKYQGFVSDPKYKHLQPLMDEWYENPHLREAYKNPLYYLASEEENDIQLLQSVNLITKYGKSLIFDTYKEAAKHESSNQNLILTTSHSSKGLEFDEVTIAADLNDAMSNAVDQVLTGEITVESREYKDIVNLCYVAASRAKKSIINAGFLNISVKLV